MFSSSMQQNDEIKEALLWHTAEKPVMARPDASVNGLLMNCTKHQGGELQLLQVYPPVPSDMSYTKRTRYRRYRFRFLDSEDAVSQAANNNSNASGPRDVKYVIKPPQSLSAASSNFLLRSMSGDCKAAVIYASNGNSNSPCAWLLAWHHPPNGPNKVYAECGEKHKFQGLNWSDIERKLNERGISSLVDFTDPATQAKIMATIGQGTVAAAFMD